MSQQPDQPESNTTNVERKQWPMLYIALAIGLFVFIFNLYLFLSEGN